VLTGVGAGVLKFCGVGAGIFKKCDSAHLCFIHNAWRQVGMQ